METAQRSMTENFELDTGLRAHGGDLIQGQFAGEDEAVDTQVLRMARSGGIGDAHLGRAVDGQVGGAISRASFTAAQSWTMMASAPDSAMAARPPRSFLQFVVEDEGC
ncbi:MAG: hypothetical protein WDO18_05520 [Acidobacteriota bacterium]